MRPNLALVTLLALLALGGGLYFIFGTTQDSLPIEATGPEITEPTGRASAPDTAVVAPAAKPDAEVPTGTERTSIAPPVVATAPTGKAAAAATLVGRVIDSAGSPVVGAEVRARVGDFDLPEFDDFGAGVRRSDPMRANSDALGRFEIPGVKPGSARLSVRAPGYVPLNKAGLGIPAVERHDVGDLALETSVVLEGRVVDSRGAPVAGARLVRANAPGIMTFELSDDPTQGPPALAVTAADGGFRIDQLASGPWRLRIGSEDHPDKTESGLTKRPGERVVGLNFVLEDGFEISGRVSGVPASAVANSSVVAMPPAAQGEVFFFGADEVTLGANRRRAKLGSDGSFVVKGLREGSYQMQARVTSGQDTFFPRSASERVEAKSGDRGVLIPWQPASVLSFQVVDAQTKAPIEQLGVSARTRASMAFLDPQARATRAYPEGLVRVDDLRPRAADDRATLDVSATGYQTLNMEDIVLERGAETDLGVLELKRATTVDVRVVDSRTRGGIEKAKVELRLVEEDEGGGMTFRMRRTIVADSGGEDVSFGGGPSTSARTDEQGFARLNSTPGRKGKLTVSCEGYAPYTSEAFEMPADRNVEHDVALDQGGSVEITLLSAEGAPVSGTRIQHRAPDADEGPFADPFGRGKGAATDSAGKVTISNLAPGLHRFRPAKGGGADAAEGMVFSFEGMDAAGAGWSEVEIVRGTTATLELREPQRAEVKGRIREGGVAMAGATLSLRKRGGDARFEGLEELPFAGGGARAKSDGDGRYRFEKVEAGSYELVVRHATRAMAARFPVEVDAGGLEYDVDLPITVIEGRVLDLEHKPVVGARVWAERKRGAGGQREMRALSIVADAGGGGEGMVIDSSSGMDATRAKTDEQGRYTLRGVENDTELEVRVEAKDCEPTRSSPVSVALGQTRTGVDIEVSPAGQLKVKIAPVAGKPPAPCMVHAEYLDAMPEGKSIQPKTEFAQGGTVTLKGLRPGRWQVYAEGFGNFETGETENRRGDPREVLVVAHEVAELELQAP